jgi:hypothetical protein
MLGFPLGILYANAVEWVLHKYVLHVYGKRKGSLFAFHWRNHHYNARRHAMRDPEYDKPIWDWNSRGKEVASIAAVVALHTPLVAVAPWFTAALWYSGFNYLYKHKRCHTDVEWGKRHMRSHYDHHMGRDQDANWCVTRPWFDWVMGTRLKFDEAATLRGHHSTQLDGSEALVPVRPASTTNLSNAANTEALTLEFVPETADAPDRELASGVQPKPAPQPTAEASTQTDEGGGPQSRSPRAA